MPGLILVKHPAFKQVKQWGAIDFGISKRIFKKNGSLKLSLQDPFNPANYKSKLNYDYLTGSGQYKWDNRAILLNFIYNFGNRNIQIQQFFLLHKSASISFNLLILFLFMFLL